jgi:hypothetical protein
MTKLPLLFSFVFLSMSAHAQLFKVSEKGNILKANDNNHRCVIDDKSALVWEVKLSEKGLQNTKNTYTWFDGKTGSEDGEYSKNCHWGEACNSKAFIQALNDSRLCQQNTWRVPSESELKTLLVYGDQDLLVNAKFFPNTQLKTYWTVNEESANIAIDVPFFYGGSKGADKSFDAYIRAVSNAN